MSDPVGAYLSKYRPTAAEEDDPVERYLTRYRTSAPRPLPSVRADATARPGYRQPPKERPLGERLAEKRGSRTIGPARTGAVNVRLPELPADELTTGVSLGVEGYGLEDALRDALTGRKAFSRDTRMGKVLDLTLIPGAARMGAQAREQLARGDPAGAGITTAFAALPVAGPIARRARKLIPAATTLVGATAGAIMNEDDRVKGALYGAGAGAAAGAAGRAVSKLRGVQRVASAPALESLALDVASGSRAVQKPGFLTSAQKLYSRIIDDVYAGRKFGEVVGKSGELSAELSRGQRWRNSAARYLRTDFKPVLEAAKGQERDVMAIATAQRALDIQARGGAWKLARTPAEAQAALAAASPEALDATRQLQNYYRRLIDMKHANGVIDDATYQAIVQSEDFYTPFVREWEDRLTRAGGSGGRKWLPTKTGVRKMDREALAYAKTQDPFERAVQDTEETFRTVAKQRVANLMTDIVRANPQTANPFIRELPASAKAQGREVAVNLAGKRGRFEILDDDLHDTLASFDPQTQSIFRAVLAPFKKTLQTGVTLLPDFAIANFIRDQGTAGVQQKFRLAGPAAGALLGAGAGAATAPEGEAGDHALIGGLLGFGAGAWAPHMVRTTKAVGGMLGLGNVSKYYDEFLREGGAMDGFYAANPKSARRALKELRGEGVVTHLTSPFRALQSLGNFIEQVPRVEKFAAVRQAGGTIPDALQKAGDITLDFQKVGGDKGIQFLRETKAFLNPRIQGVDKLARMLNPLDKAGRETYAMGAATITAPTVALWLVNRDDPAYQQRPMWEKNLYWLVPKENGDFWRIPKPFELGYVFASIPERFLDYMAERDPEALKRGLTSIMGEATSGFTPLPTAAEVGLQVGVNRDFFRGRPIVPRPDLLPREQYDEYTSSAALKTGQTLDISPQKIDFVVKALTGTSGAHALRGLDEIARAVGIDERAPLPEESRPILARFTTRQGVRTDEEEAYWQRYQKAESVRRSAKAAFDRDDREGFASIVRENADALRDYETLRPYERAFEKIREMKQTVRRDKTLDVETRRWQLRTLNQLAARLAAAAKRGVQLTQDEGIEPQ